MGGDVVDDDEAVVEHGGAAGAGRRADLGAFQRVHVVGRHARAGTDVHMPAVQVQQQHGAVQAFELRLDEGR
jgi:hypothetical protein